MIDRKVIIFPKIVILNVVRNLINPPFYPDIQIPSSDESRDSEWRNPLIFGWTLFKVFIKIGFHKIYNQFIYNRLQALKKLTFPDFL